MLLKIIKVKVCLHENNENEHNVQNMAAFK